MGRGGFDGNSLQYGGEWCYGKSGFVSWRNKKEEALHTECLLFFVCSK